MMSDSGDILVTTKTMKAIINVVIILKAHHCLLLVI